MKKIQLTDTHKEKLFQIPLFRDLPLNIKESLLEKLDFVVYAADKKEIVVTQGTPCNKLYVLLEGKLRTDIIDGLGNEVMIEYIIAPRTFATPHLFNPNNTLPATFTALEDSVILMATKDSTFKVISQDPQVLHNFLCIAGNCNICTVSRLKPLSRKTVRERFIVYLFEHKKKDSLIVEITHTQSQLAEYLNVSRPALSKEINKIIKEHLEEILKREQPSDEAAIQLCLYCMKAQIFTDGNKRASVIFANHYLISQGGGMLIIPEKEVPEFKRLLVAFYEDRSNDIFLFMKEKCVKTF